MSESETGKGIYLYASKSPMVAKHNRFGRSQHIDSQHRLWYYYSKGGGMMSRLWEDIDGVFCDAPRIGEKDTFCGDEFMIYLELQAHYMLQGRNGVEPVDKTKPDWYYCIASGGRVFKCDMKFTAFYWLDMERYVWIPDPTIPITIFDEKVPFWEFGGFIDYYDEL